MATLTQDPVSGAWSGSPGRSMVELGSNPSADPYTKLNQGLASILSQIQAAGAKGAGELGRAKDALTTEAVGAAGAYDPTATPGVNVQNQQGTFGAFAPAITGVNTQLENANSALGNFTGAVNALQTAYKPQAIGADQSFVSPSGTILIQGKQYSVVPDVTNPGQYKAIPTTSQTSNVGPNNPSNPSGASSSTDNPAIIGGVNFGATPGGLGAYATDTSYADHLGGLYKTVTSLGVASSAPKLQEYITNNAKSSPVTAAMIMNAASQYRLDPALLTALFLHESDFGTAGQAAKNNNPGGILYVGQSGASQGTPRPQNEGGYYAAYPSWQQGVFAAAANLSKRTGTTSASAAESPYAVSTKAAQYGDDVLSGRRGYSDAVSGMALYPGVGKQALDDYIRTQNPTFNFAQADTLAGQQGSIGPAYKFAKTALLNVQDAMKNLGFAQGTNVPAINFLGNNWATASGQGSEQTRTVAGAVQEARNAYSQLLAASRGGTPTAYGDQSKIAIPDNPTPNDIAGAITNLEKLGQSKVGIYGNPGGGTTEGATKDYNGVTYKVVKGVWTPQ